MRKKWKNSFFYRLIFQFIFIVVIPIFCSWLIFEEVLKVYYAKNTLNVQYHNMQNRIELLENAMEAAQNAVEPLAINKDIFYYLEYKSTKSPMPYGAFLRVKTLTESLNQTVPYLENINIYCDSPLVLYAWPFMNWEKYPVKEEVVALLENARVNEMIWETSFSEKGGCQMIYGYQKIYSTSYPECIGYLEICLSSKLLRECLDMIIAEVEKSDGIMTVYHNNAAVFSTVSGGTESVENGNCDPGYELLYWKRQYRYVWTIEALNICIEAAGPMTGLFEPLTMMSPSLIISVIIVSLLFLFIMFFVSVLSLSKRILHFADFMQKSDSNNLLPYQDTRKIDNNTDELDSLIDTYNKLIRENNTLISKVEKMELITQAARFKALQHQIHPHFLHGTLETIRYMVLFEQNDEAADMIYSLSVLLRYSVAIDEKPITLREELEIAGHYMTIQQTRFGDRVRYSVQVEESLMEMLLPAFVLQPVLENAILYGCSQCREFCEVAVKVSETENEVVITVSNTGQLISWERMQEVNRLLTDGLNPEEFRGNRNGKALFNIKERLKIFFDGKAAVQIIRQENQTINRISISKK